MKGTAKQIKWAEYIKEKISANNYGMATLTEAGQKAVDYIDNIENASFWIDYRDYSGVSLLQSLASGTLRVKGFSFSNTAKITPEGTIIESWDEIVPDGKGGHKETRTKIIE